MNVPPTSQPVAEGELVSCNLRRHLLMGLIAACMLTLVVPRGATQTIPAVNPSHDHPAPGTKLTRFEKIDDGVYKGSEPGNDADYRFLQSKHIKYISR
jgi:hypothetical protein